MSKPLPTLKVLLADDHPTIRIGIRAALQIRYATDVTEARDARTALDHARARKFDLILLDITMPGRSGLDILPDLKIAQPTTPVLVVSMHAEDQFALRVLQAGAAGFINKSALADELLTAVEKVLAGRRHVSESLGERLAADFVRGGHRESHETLSAREFEILRMIALGKSGKEIAADLSISYKTVSTYRTRMLKKLGLRNNHDLREYALRERLLEDSAL